MNSNRTRYTSTPTFGMQKRNFAKKIISQHQAQQTPDFSQAPTPVNGMPLQNQPFFGQPFSQPANAPAQPQPPQGNFMPVGNFYPNSPTAQGMPQMPQPMPFAAPVFMQSGMPFPPMPNTMQQPLPNHTPTMGNASFSARAQGFVPPQAAPAQATVPVVQQAPVQPSFASKPQTVPPFSGMQPPVQQPFAYQAVPQQGMPQQNVPFTQNASPSMQQTRAPRQPITADQVWTVYLFVLLPLLLIPCFFVTGIWAFLRYVFIGATVIGLGAMWYRQMYSPATRLITSVIYVAFCIGCIAMLMQGTADVRQTSAAANSNPAAVTAQQPVVEESIAAADPTEVPVQATPTPPPVSGPSEAEKRLDLFMNLWMVNNTTEMVQLVQPSWCSKQENPSMALFMVLANRTPEDFVIEEITGSDTDNSRTVTMRATINKNTGKAPSIYRFMIMMVKEGEEWYVNPNSLATNDKEAAKADENVVKTQSVGTATEAPRTTVTPAPPASTTLYYNIGGNYYHMDPNCPSVNADNLPFGASFSYSDLKEVKASTNLLPCLKCGAPVNTLDNAVQ